MPLKQQKITVWCRDL